MPGFDPIKSQLVSNQNKIKNESRNFGSSQNFSEFNLVNERLTEAEKKRRRKKKKREKEELSASELLIDAQSIALRVGAGRG